ncbi:hypothetical protein DRP05_12595 [Archaeoglobales archaeon]|nr:MAG: hypothetical protein DRP05_12595 [Archaeoglobales archaeon]
MSNLLVLDAARWFNRILFSGVEGHLPEEKERMLEKIHVTKERILELESKGVKILNCNDLVKLGIIM